MHKNNSSVQTSTNTDQLDFWLGSTGNKYIHRNKFEPWKVEPGKKAFNRILDGYKFKSVLEVGSNIGLNLIYLSHLYGESINLYAVEPNKSAYDKLTKDSPLKKIIKAYNCDAFKLPFKNEDIDLVFTSGVLIHIAPEDLKRATDEIIRVSKQYILCIEYFSHKPESVEYRGRDGFLFKRDFGAFYEDTYPELKCINYGFLWQREFPVFDNLNWWLFEK